MNPLIRSISIVLEAIVLGDESRMWNLSAWPATEVWVSRSCDWSSPSAAGGTENVDGSGEGWVAKLGGGFEDMGEVCLQGKCVRVDERYDETVENSPKYH